MLQDHYKILGVTPRTDADAIRAAYRRLVRETHPDMTDDTTAHQRFKAVSEAYRVLSDAKQRRQYDALRFFLLAAPLRRLANVLTDPQSRTRLGGALLTVARRLARAPFEDVSLDGANIDMARGISFVESFTGTTLSLRYERLLRCVDCEGAGWEEHEACPLCHGRGVLTFPIAGVIHKRCPKCSGRGVVGAGRCRPCHGQGRVPSETNVTVRVPPGVDSDTLLRAKGKGHQGLAGHEDGDLFLSVSVDGSLHFSRNALDLHVEKAIPLCIAISGGRAAVALPDDTAIEIVIPPGTYPGSKLRAAARGFHSPPHKKRGDLIVHLDVYLPDDLDHNQRALADEWFHAAHTGDEAAVNRHAAQLLRQLEGLVCCED
ncbi:MAG: DnaJ C-terminal domain-containing protein [Candidatus Lernaella stagnicola]|nr:DnaJ C-terminal domain-containing protein [Candidatus Lernaella stagnicola]